MRDLLPEEMNDVSGACAPHRSAPCNSHGQQEPIVERDVDTLVNQVFRTLDQLI